MAIFLVRHAETEGNARRILQMPDTPLSERGLAQAERVARRLGAENIGHILASDYSRASMTAEAIRGVTRAPLELELLLRERNFGDLRGTPYAELAEDPFGPDYVPPGGESWEDLHSRVDAAWSRVLEAAAGVSGNLAVVTHGLVCHSVLRHATRADTAEILRFDNTSVTVIEAEPPHEVHLINCTAHLEEDARGGAGGIA